MGYYKYLPHTADLRIKAVGKDLPDLFNSSLKGLCNILSDINPTIENKEITEKIEIESIDDTALLIDFLSESLLLMYKDKAILSEVKFINLENQKIIAEISGFHIESFAEDIKAVTYHEAQIITNNENHLEVIITLDI